MNILEILEENSVLLEAVRISTPQDAYELIKNKKLGIKMHPSYNNVDDKESKDKIKVGVNTILQSIKNVNNLVYAIQLFVNKVPIDKLQEIVDNNWNIDLIEYRNKPWSKEIPEYKDFIELNGKPISNYETVKIIKKMKEEAQKHGHGDKKEAKTLYDDGIWTLQVPTSFKGAKAISFYGKKGEQQIPTEWCTRTELFWYNKYASKSPLYVIRNWDTGKSYQISFEKDVVNFLDEKDVKGDKITRGNLLAIPDKLLELIKWNGKSLKDYKDMDKKSRGGKIIKGTSFKDGTNDLVRARWGDDIKLEDNIIKNVWENFSNKEESDDKITDYMINNKTFGYTKHDGNWAAKYYFKRNPDYFIVMRRADWTDGNFVENYYFDGESDIEEIDRSEFREAVGGAEQELLLKVAKDDIGQTKRDNRLRNKKTNHLEKPRSFYWDSFKVLEKYLLDDLTKIVEKQYGKDFKVKMGDQTTNMYAGSFIPRVIRVNFFDFRNREVGQITFERGNNNKLKYDADVSWYGGYNGNPTSDNRIKQDAEQLVNKKILDYSKEMIKNETGMKLRNNAKIVDAKLNQQDTSNPYRKTYYEDYFPY